MVHNILVTLYKSGKNIDSPYKYLLPLLEAPNKSHKA